MTKADQLAESFDVLFASDYQKVMSPGCYAPTAQGTLITDLSPHCPMDAETM
jgi:hypothetical protein